MFHRQFGENGNQDPSANITADNADDADAIQAGVTPAELGNAADTAVTTDFCARNLCNLCKSMAE